MFDALNHHLRMVCHMHRIEPSDEAIGTLAQHLDGVQVAVVLQLLGPELRRW